ncbi:MAG: hypothetical protein ACI83O_000387 [Patescibacteria group bacterium]|jgi:uncharacterized protein (UPF0332 family)
MNINRLYIDKDYLKKQLSFFTSKNHIQIISPNIELAQSHLQKARHNLKFYQLNKMHSQFSDWLIVTLYYALYHSALALITKRNLASKNHHATILILIKEYSISQEQAELLNQLSINKEDAEFYTILKNERHNASYQTSIKFDKKTISGYESKVLDFINKAEELLEQ